MCTSALLAVILMLHSEKSHTWQRRLKSWGVQHSLFSRRPLSPVPPGPETTKPLRATQKQNIPLVSLTTFSGETKERWYPKRKCEVCVARATNIPTGSGNQALGGKEEEAVLHRARLREGNDCPGMWLTGHAVEPSCTTLGAGDTLDACTLPEGV